MSKGLKTTLIVLGVLAGIALLVGGGFWLGRSTSTRGRSAYYGRWERGNMPGMIDGRNFKVSPDFRDGYRMGLQRGRNSSYNVTPLTVEESKKAIQSYLDTLKNSDLVLKKIIIFDNHAYGLIAEQSTGKGAMEVTVNPLSKVVGPERGANMLWNLKYGRMSGIGCTQGGVCSKNPGLNGGLPSTENIAEMTITPTQAVQYAQAYLDKNLSGNKAADNPVAFYGYYSLEYSKDGKPVGILSVNGYTGQVWLHSWLGTFIEEWTAE